MQKNRIELAGYLGKTPQNISHKISNTRGKFDPWEILATAEWLGVTVGVLYGTEPMPQRLGEPGSFLAAEAGNMPPEQRRRKGDQLPILQDVQFVTACSDTLPARNLIAA